MCNGAALPDLPKGTWMTNLPWMQIYIGDELAETIHLTAEEYGAHMLLRLHQWKHGELPHDEERLMRICRVDRDRWPIIRDVLAPLFDWIWHHQRTAEVRRQSEEKHANLSANGRKGGRPPKEKKADEKPMESQAFDRLKAEYKADGKQSPSPSQSQSHPYSPSALTSPSDAHSQGSALDKEDKEGTYTRERLTTPFPIPSSPAEGRALLTARGVPQSDMDKCLRLLLDGNLSPFDIEQYQTRERGAA